MSARPRRLLVLRALGLGDLLTGVAALRALREAGLSAELVASGSPRKRFDKAAKIPAHALISIGQRDGAPHVNIRGEGETAARAEAVVRQLG